MEHLGLREVAEVAVEVAHRQTGGGAGQLEVLAHLRTAKEGGSLCSEPQCAVSCCAVHRWAEPARVRRCEVWSQQAGAKRSAQGRAVHYNALEGLRRPAAAACSVRKRVLWGACGVWWGRTAHLFDELHDALAVAQLHHAGWRCVEAVRAGHQRWLGHAHQRHSLYGAIHLRV